MGKDEISKIERKIKILNISIIIGILALVALSTPFIVAQFRPASSNITTTQFTGFTSRVTPQNMSEIVNSCRNMNLKDSSMCVVDKTQVFYKYNMNNIGKTLNFSQLVSEGGVCSNWSEYYTQLGEDLGYEAKNVIIMTSGDSAHEFSVWSNKGGYCVIDQTEAQCFSLAQ